MTRPRHRLLLLATAVLVPGLLASCTAMPVHGPVVVAGEDTSLRNDDPADIVVQGPSPGEAPTDIVSGFLDAMTASPLSTSVAKEYLTKSGAEDWKPERETITYADKTRPFASQPVRVSLIDANHLDARGSWLGQLPAGRRTLRFPIVLENGEWRIARAPNALIVPDTWFEPRFAQVSLYYFDQSGRVLVPEPVFLPLGDQLPTALTNNLLLGPPAGLERVDRTFLPPGTTAGLSVPVSKKGVAQVDLKGGQPALTPGTTDRMMAQLAWTLRQVPGIKALSVSVGDKRIGLPGQPDVVSADWGEQYDPTGALATRELFGLSGGRLVSGSVTDLFPVEGPLGTGHQELQSFAVDPLGRRVAGVTSDGRVLVSPVETPGRRVRQVAEGVVDPLPPSYDLLGRIWLLDSHQGKATVTVVRHGRPHEVDVPGVTGHRVRAFLVSRDGTRLVAGIAGGAGTQGDSIVMSRIAQNMRGRPEPTPARVIPVDTEGPLRVRDLGWRTATSLVALTRLTQALSQVRVVSVDGAPVSVPLAPITLRGRMRWLISSPVQDQTTYAVSRRGAVDLADVQRTTRPRGVTLSTLTYAG